jgi:Fe2+ transport system protein FeoA
LRAFGKGSTGPVVTRRPTCSSTPSRPSLEERIIALPANPTTCPQGSPIPGSGASLAADLVPLASLALGATATVQFISEELEEDLDLLRYLERGGIMPGRRLRVREVVPASDLMVVEAEGQPVPLGLKVAQKVRVRPQPAPVAGPAG